MYSCKRLVGSAALMLLACLYAAGQETTIVQSTTVSASVGAGILISNEHFMGMRFTTEAPVQVTRIGGAMQTTGSVFGAIVRLSGPGALPTGSPFDSDSVVASTIMPVTSGQNQTIFAPLSVRLEPGTYGLVFGSGYLGASGRGGMPFGGPIQSCPSAFDWDINKWRNMPANGERFIVMGFPAEQPSLFTEEGTDIAVALDSVTLLRDPFTVLTENNFSSDHHTRITLFGEGLRLLPCEDDSVVSAELEDSKLVTRPLPVEAFETVPGFDWMKQITFKLPDEIKDESEVLIRVKVHGSSTNSARVRIAPSATPQP